MSIVERVAELLGPIERSNSKSSAPGELGPIERAVSEIPERSGFRGARELAAQLEATGIAADLKTKAEPERPAGRTSRTISIDRDRLRQQRIITPDGERTPIAEGFRRIKRQILANVANPKAGAPANLVLVTSALAAEGKTFCAINLAISIALEMDRTVLLVDADVAKPSVPQALGIKAQIGLMDVLLDRRIDLAEVLCKTDIDKLTVLPAGTAHQRATELLASDAMRMLLREMASRYHDRIIIFDSPPLLAASEAGVLASQMGTYEGVGGVALVEERIRDDKNIGVWPGVGAKRHISRVDRGKRVGAGYRPLAAGINESNERDCRPANVRGEPEKIFNDLLRSGIQNVETAQGFQLFRFMVRVLHFHSDAFWGGSAHYRYPYSHDHRHGPCAREKYNNILTPPSKGIEMSIYHASFK